MKVITTTEARKHLSKVITAVRYKNTPIAIGRRDKAEALIIKFPDKANDNLSEMTNINNYGGAFDFLEDEPDIYSRADIKKSYA